VRHEAIKKRDGQWVKVRPALQIYDHSAVLQETVEDAWCVSDITDSSLKLTSRDTELSRVVGLDHVHHYMEDPEGLRTLETVGTLVMNVQMLLYQGSLHAEPVAPPGSPLKSFVPAKPRASLLDAAAKGRAKMALERAQKEFAWSAEGVNAAQTAWANFTTDFERLGEELREAGHPIDDLKVKTIYGGPVLLRAAGWWVMLLLEGMTVNCIEHVRLEVRQLDGPPKWPNLMVFEEPRQVWREKYGFGLVAIGAPRWLVESKPELSYTTSDLAQELLTRLLERPNPKR
jgi:hypothetical protein